MAPRNINKTNVRVKFHPTLGINSPLEELQVFRNLRPKTWQADILTSWSCLFLLSLGVNRMILNWVHHCSPTVPSVCLTLGMNVRTAWSSCWCTNAPFYLRPEWSLVLAAALGQRCSPLFSAPRQTCWRCRSSSDTVTRLTRRHRRSWKACCRTPLYRSRAVGATPWGLRPPAR